MVRVPDRLLAEDHLPLDHRRNLAVAAPEIEPDPAAFEMAAERLRFRLLVRQVRRADDRERVIEHSFPDQVSVEPAGGGVGVVCGHGAGKGGGGIEVDAPPSARPEQELEKALEVARVRHRSGMCVGQHAAFEPEHRPVRLLQGDPHRHGAGRGVHQGLEGMRAQHRRPEARIEHRRDLRCHEREAVVGVHVAEIDTTTAVQERPARAATFWVAAPERSACRLALRRGRSPGATLLRPGRRARASPARSCPRHRRSRAATRRSGQRGPPGRPHTSGESSPSIQPTRKSSYPPAASPPLKGTNTTL